MFRIYVQLTQDSERMYLNITFRPPRKERKLEDVRVLGKPSVIQKKAGQQLGLRDTAGQLEESQLQN